MKAKISAFLKKYNIFDVFILSSGSVISQAIKILSQPIATRIYTPAQFGIIALISELASMFNSVSSFQYELCIVSSDTEEEADKITGMCFYLLLFTSALFFLGIFIFNRLSPDTYGSAGNLIYFAVILFFFHGISSILRYYNNRYSQYKLMSYVVILSSLIYATLKIGLGLLGAGIFGLLAATLLVDIVGVRRRAKKLWENKARVFGVKPGEIKQLLIKYISQPLAHTPGLFLLSYTFSIIPLFMMTLYGNLSYVGYYSQATTILALPLTLISNNISSVFFKNACTEMTQTGCFKNSFKSTSLFLLALAVVPFILLYWLAPWAFGFFFGEQWVTSGIYARLLIPMFFTRFFSTSVNCGLVVCKKQKANIILNGMLLIASVCLFYVAKKFALSVEAFLLSLSLSYSVINAIKYFAVFKYSKG